MRNISMVAGLVGLMGFVACGDTKPPVASDATAGKSSGGKSSGGNDGGAGGEGGDPETGGKFGRAGSGGKGGKGSVGDGGDAGGGGEGGAMEVGTPPTVTILSPGPVTNALGGQVLVEDDVEVTCKVEQGDSDDAAAVDPLSVKVAVLGADGSVVSEKPAGLAATNEYSALVPLTAATSGKITLRCTAESTTNAVGSDSVDTLADRGPKLTLVTPAPDTRIALKDKVKVAITAIPQPLSDGDTQADVDTLELKVNGVHVDTAPVNGTPGSYTADLDFSSAAFDGAKPNGDTTFGITATNKRAPDPATAAISPKVVVDGAGPIINVTAPTANKLVGGFVTVNFTVADALSGLNKDSLIVKLNDDVRTYDAADEKWKNPGGGSTYTYEFDSRSVVGAKVQINVTVVAKDNVGNESLSTTITTYLDNVKPLVDLDPSPIRTQNAGDCSSPMDPVGNDAMSDYIFGKVSSGYDFARVFVWDKTNQVVGSPAQLHFAGINPNSVRVYFQNPGGSPALLINKSSPGTGVCDDIGDTSNSISMSKLDATGAPLYNGDASSDPKDATCSAYPGLPTAKPVLLCNGTKMWQVVRHIEGDVNEAAVYARPSIPLDCTGGAWDFSSLVADDRQDGFVCLAARAVDMVGNVAVSPPIRVCVDLDLTDNKQPKCATMSIANPPSCTDGCTPPARIGGSVIPL